MPKLLASRSAKRFGVIYILTLITTVSVGSSSTPSIAERIFEQTFESRKSYGDAFNDVDVDVVFERGGHTWRVPTFWRGGSRWTVRFAPPAPGDYIYHLESTDRRNPDLNGHAGRVTIIPYRGTNALLMSGMIRVSANKRYFEDANGTPFYWLGDTWWMGLSDRLSWEGFQALTRDRKAKGFTVVQLVTGLVPYKAAPGSPGFSNEGGGVWTSDFAAINPGYFDYADRRIEYLISEGIVPAIVGGWYDAVDRLSVEKLKKHWRCIIARYGAFPVFWVLGGEVYDPAYPATGDDAARLERIYGEETYLSVRRSRGEWSEVARFIRQTDPYHHPLTAHEWNPDEQPLQAESLTDFQLLQPSHFGWPSIAVEVARLNLLYAREDVTKPLVVGEIGYEGAFGAFENYERAAFWLALLNGATGFTYGAAAVVGAATPVNGYARKTWQEGMRLPGSYQVGLGARLVQQFPWWEFTPHPEWVAPRGTTLLEPRKGNEQSFHMDLLAEWNLHLGPRPKQSEWSKRNGDLTLPYASGVPGRVRIIYIPDRGLAGSMRDEPPPTVLGLEPGVSYHAYYWDPALGTKIELGRVRRPAPGAILVKDPFNATRTTEWKYVKGHAELSGGHLSTRTEFVGVADGIDQKDVSVSVGATSDSSSGVVLRYQDMGNLIVAIYSPEQKLLYISETSGGLESERLGETAVPGTARHIRLNAEVRNRVAAASLTDGVHTYMTPIVDVKGDAAGRCGLLHSDNDHLQRFDDFEIRTSPEVTAEAPLQVKLHDAQGTYRGALGAEWEESVRMKNVLLESYRPPQVGAGDWVLVLDAENGPMSN